MILGFLLGFFCCLFFFFAKNIAKVFANLLANVFIIQKVMGNPSASLLGNFSIL